MLFKRRGERERERKREKERDGEKGRERKSRLNIWAINKKLKSKKNNVHLMLGCFFPSVPVAVFPTPQVFYKPPESRVYHP